MKKIIILIMVIILLGVMLTACTAPNPKYEVFEGVVSGIKNRDSYTIIYINGRNIRVEDGNIILAVGREYRITTKDITPENRLYSRRIYKIEIID